MTLTYQTSIRNETDQTTIDNLKRKGWVENPAPNYNPATHKAPVWEGTTWVVDALTQSELDAIAAQAADASEATAIKNMIAKLLNPGVDTQAQRITRLERIMVRVIKQILQ